MENYKKVKVIGKGAFGAAVLVHARANPKEHYVIKQVEVSRLKPKERDEAKKEIKLLASFHHPNIVRYRDAFLEQGVLNIVMDYAEGGDLSNLLKEQGTRHLREEQVLDYFVQLCLAMKHVHDRKVLHRDIKSQNVFLTQNRKVLKLGVRGSRARTCDSRSAMWLRTTLAGGISAARVAYMAWSGCTHSHAQDFGIARVLNATTELARTACGTPYYMSPEVKQWS